MSAQTAATEGQLLICGVLTGVDSEKVYVAIKVCSYFPIDLDILFNA